MMKLNKRSKGFTLIEIMIAIAIGVTIIGIMIPSIITNSNRAKVSTTVVAINSTMGLLQTYKLENGHFPSTEQGLAALVEKPAGDPVPRNWRTKYAPSLPLDAWNNEFLYFNESGKVELISLGDDGFEGGVDVAADISSND